MISFDKPGNHSIKTSTYGQSVASFYGEEYKVNNVATSVVDTLKLSIYAKDATHSLGWNNCWVFGNGVESDRIQDDFNAPQMDNGVKVSSTIANQVKEEHRKHGLIWSGIYNSTSGVNNTNQFVMAEKITKDLNPIYGSIQKLYNRDTRLIMFCEDKILRGVTNKDALYNADGNPQLVASNKVIGDVTTYQGDYGISTNPESFVATPYQMYFTDVTRGQVLRMTSEGIVSISDKGMRNYFADKMASNVWKALGTYDERKKEYNLSVLKKNTPAQVGYNSDSATISYGELSKGWVSVKSFLPQSGLSINNKYFTFHEGHMWEHYTNTEFNSFYDSPYLSDVTVVLNDKPESTKSFNSISYEGSQAKVANFGTEVSTGWLTGNASDVGNGVSSVNVVDGEYYNIGTEIKGWYVENIETNLQTCGEIQFKEKEGKWFGYPSGETTSLDNLDEREFTVQGLGTASVSHSSVSAEEDVTITIANNTSTSYNPSGDGVWDVELD